MYKESNNDNDFTFRRLALKNCLCSVKTHVLFVKVVLFVHILSPCHFALSLKIFIVHCLGSIYSCRSHVIFSRQHDFSKQKCFP